jgi:hypothetical protein
LSGLTRVECNTKSTMQNPKNLFMLKLPFLNIKKVQLIIWLCVFLALKNRKVEVSLLVHMPPCSEDDKVKHFILSKSGREFNSYHFGPFSDEKILNFDEF